MAILYFYRNENFESYFSQPVMRGENTNLSIITFNVTPSSPPPNSIKL